MNRMMCSMLMPILFAATAAAEPEDAPAVKYEAGNVPTYVELDKGEQITFRLHDGAVRTIRLVDYDRTSADVLIDGAKRRIQYRPQDLPARVAGMRIGVEVTRAWSDRMRFGWFGLKKECRLFLGDASRPVMDDPAGRFPLSPPAVIRRGTLWGGGWLAERREDRKDCHIGYDLYGPLGTKALAMEDVLVKDVWVDKDYGDMLVVDLEGERLGYRYLHLMEVFVKAGQKLKGGDEVGLIGQTGYAIYPHLHIHMMLPDAGKAAAAADTGEAASYFARTERRVNVNPTPYIHDLYDRLDPKGLIDLYKVSLKAVDADGNPVKWPHLYVKSPDGKTYDVGIHMATSVRAGMNPYTFIFVKAREKLRGETTVTIEKDGQEVVIVMQPEVDAAEK
jgi:hypothetical protein